MNLRARISEVCYSRALPTIPEVLPLLPRDLQSVGDLYPYPSLLLLCSLLTWFAIAEDPQAARHLPSIRAGHGPVVRHIPKQIDPHSTRRRKERVALSRS